MIKVAVGGEQGEPRNLCDGSDPDVVFTHGPARTVAQGIKFPIGNENRRAIDVQPNNLAQQPV